MRHIEFIINTAAKNKYGNIHFVRFIYNNFKNKFFMGFKDTKNSVWGEKWFSLNIKEILKILNQMQIVKSKSTKASYVKFLAYGAASYKLFANANIDVFSFVVQKSSTKLELASVFPFSLASLVKVRVSGTFEITQLLMLQKTFKLT